MVEIIEESLGIFVRVVHPKEVGITPKLPIHAEDKTENKASEAKISGQENIKDLPFREYPTIYEESFGGVTRRIVSIHEINAAIAKQNAPKP